MSSNAIPWRPEPVGGDEPRRESRRANRRRLLVFGGVALVAAIIGLVYDFARPAQYQASARLEFVAANGAPAGVDAPFGLRDEVQYLTSRTLLVKVWSDLSDASTTPAALRTGDPPATLQAMLDAAPVEGTHIVTVRARGPDPAFLPRLVEHVVADYRAGLGERYRGGATVAATEAAEEVRRLDASVVALRREADAFRARHRIVSLERDENQVLSGARGLGASLNAANDKLVAAEARLAALTEAEAAGRAVTRSRDNPTLAALQQEAARIRADLQETARTFTPAYLDIDPRIKTLRARLADIEQQIVVQRQGSQQDAIQEARDDVTGARAAVAALRRQAASDQDATQAFTSRFDEFRAMQDQVTRLEALRQKAAERVAVLQAEQQSRMPKVQVLEAAATPLSPFSPSYGRDAGIALAAAIGAGLIAMAIVELFNRPVRLPSTVVVPQAWTAIGPTGLTVALPSAPTFEALGHAIEPTTPAPQLEAPTSLPRELSEAEIAALLTAADEALRPAIALLLTGLTAGEVVALRRGDLQRDRASLVVAGADERAVDLPARLLAWLPVDAVPAASPLLTGAAGRPLSEAALATSLLYAAHDAAIARADEITPDALRHTCIAFLLRQGVRFAELARRVGALAPERLAAYRRMIPPSATAAPAAVESVLPGLDRPPG